jgi:hypothetical protein
LAFAVTATRRVYCKEPLVTREAKPLPVGEKLENLAPLAREIGVHPSALWRWIDHGARLSDGSRVYPDAWATPGAWKSTREAIQRFLGILTADRQARSGDPAPAPRSPARRAREHARAERALTELGV